MKIRSRPPKVHFLALTNTFPVNESQPIIIPHEYIQLVELPLLGKNHSTNFNYKLYYPIQNTHHVFSVTPEQVKIIKSFEPLWHLLTTRTVISILAKLIMQSLIIGTNFPNDFFTNTDSS